jgi:hypothetical protein
MTAREPRAVALWALVVTAFGLVTLAASGEPLAPILLFDGPSYVALAEHVRTHWFFPPPSMNLRPPLYPTVIAVAGWLTGTDGLAAVVRLQALAWLAVGPLVMLWIYRVDGRPLLAVTMGCLTYTLGESFLNIQLIYAETLTTALSVAAGLALAWSMTGGGRRAGSRWLAAALALASAQARAVYQLLLPLYAAFAALAPRTPPLRGAAPFLAATLIGLAPFYVVHAIVKGSPSFVAGAGHSLANYLGDRRLVGKFPPGLEAVEALYATRFAADPGKRRIGWWEVAPDWDEIIRTRTGRSPKWGVRDRDMMLTTLAVLWRNPDYAVARWGEAWSEFSTTPGPRVAGRFSPVNLLGPGWTYYWQWLGAWTAFVVLAIEVVHVAVRGPGMAVRLVPIVTYLGVSLANTAIEPWTGQIRYRSQVEAFLVVALGLVAGLLFDCGRAGFARVRRGGGRTAAASM